MRGVALASLLAVTACKKDAAVQIPRVEEEQVLTMLRTRPVPDPAQARFSIKIRSRPLSIAAPRLGGGLVVDRPERAYLAVLDPLGSPVIELAADGEQVVFVNNRDRQFVVQRDADDALGGATKGAISMSDVVGMLIGLLPIDEAQLISRDIAGEQRVFVFKGPGGLQVAAWVDPATATPRRVEVTNRRGQRVLNATYEPFELVDGKLVPSGVALEVPSVELFVDVDFKSWRAISEPPDVFSPDPPERYAIIPFQQFIDKMGEAVGDGATDEPVDDPADE